MVKFGDIVKQVRKDKDLSYVKLENMSGISKRQIQRIEKSDIVEGKLNTLQALSNSLEIDLVEYAMVFTDFRDFREFKLYVRLRELIENYEYNELEQFLDKLKDTHNQGNNSAAYNQLILYGHSILCVTLHSDYRKGLRFCYKALGVSEHDFCIQSIKKYLLNDISFNVLSQIGSYSFCLGEKDFSIQLAEKVIDQIEYKYFNSDLPKTKVSTLIFRAYIALTNNLADMKFTDKKYEESIDLCEKCIRILNRHDNHYLLYMIHMLMSESYYLLENISKSFFHLNKSVSQCIITENYNYIDKIKSKIAKSYPKLADAKILTILDDL